MLVKTLLYQFIQKTLVLHCDSTKIRLQLKKNSINYYSKDTIIRNLKYTDSINYNISVDSAGIYTAVVTLDYDNWIPLENKNNNILNINIPVKNTTFIPLRPVRNSVINSDSVEFTALNPRLNPTYNNIKVLLQFDTTSKFNSPVNKNFFNNNISGVVTKFKTSIPSPVNNRIYFWRTNCIVNNDSSGWSEVQTFIYNNSVSSVKDNSKNENRADKFEVGNTADNISTGNISVLKNNPPQYSQADFSNTKFNSNGIALSDYPANLYVRSLGSNAEEASYFSVGNKNIYIDGGLNNGLNILKVKKVDGTIIERKNLKISAGTSSNDSLVTFLNTFDSTHYLMLLNAAYFPGGYLNASSKAKLRQFGSIYCDSIGLISYFHTWSLIGYLGANQSQVSEMFDPCCRPIPNCFSCDGHWQESISSKDVTLLKTSGTVSNIVGPAQSWTDFSWTQTLYPGSTIKFDVYGIDANNQQTLLFSDLQSNAFNDLSSINAYQYPKLNLIAK